MPFHIPVNSVSSLLIPALGLADSSAEVYPLGTGEANYDDRQHGQSDRLHVSLQSVHELLTTTALLPAELTL
jgi:hypothetical protein